VITDKVPDAMPPSLSRTKPSATGPSPSWPHHISYAADYRGNQPLPFTCFMCPPPGTCAHALLLLNTHGCGTPTNGSIYLYVIIIPVQTDKVLPTETTNASSNATTSQDNKGRKRYRQKSLTALRNTLPKGSSKV
jgi:hypothetical protein